MSDVQEKEQPKTKVMKLKIGGDWDWNVSFVQTFQEQTLKTNDQPKDSMVSAIANVVIRALEYLDISDVTATMREIAFGSNDDGENFALVLNMKSRNNPYVYLTCGLSKIDRKVMVNDETLEDIEGFEGRNTLNDAVDVLEEEIRKYALGDRLQQQLKFENAKKEDNRNQLDIFSSGIEMNNMESPVVIDVDFSTHEAARK